MTNKVDIAIEIMELFKRHDCDAYLVGGSVRDLILDKPIKDIDIATDCKPGDVELMALSHNLTFVPTGLKHGTVTIIYKNNPIEVTTFRVDKKCDGRHADVQFVCSLEEDLSRRDFTINAMAMDIDGNIIDMLGGKEDLIDGIIRTVGDPEIRFEEDKLRILRAIRFATVLDFSIEPETFEAIKRTNLSGISNERIRDEISKILVSPNRSRGLELLDQSNLLGQIFPEIIALKGVEANEIHHPEKDTFIHTVLAINALPPNSSLELVLATLFHDIAKPLVREVTETDIHFYEHECLGADISEKILYRLKFTKETIDKVKWLVANHMRIHYFHDMRKAKKIKLVREPYFEDLLELLRADIMGSAGIRGIPEDFAVLDSINKFITDYQEEIKRRPPPKERLITGVDILGLGIKPGKQIGTILEAIEDEVLEGNIQTREDALELAKRLVAENYGIDT